MPYISSAERFGIEKGLETGRQEGLQTGAREARFGAVPAEIQEMISAQSDLSTPRRWHRQAITVTDLAVFPES